MESHAPDDRSPLAVGSGSAVPDWDASWVITMGVLLGASMFTISLTGLVGRLTAVSVSACLLLATAAAVRCSRWLGADRIRMPVWMALPLLIPSALAALLPPYTWDEVAYGAAFPLFFARAGRFGYNSDYGVHMAMPGNYETLVTGSLLLTGHVEVTQLLNVVLALGLAVVAVLLARALGVSRTASLLAGLFVLCAPALIEVTPRTKNDVANAFFQSLAVLVLAACLTRPTYSRALLAGAFLGLSLGIKYSSLQFMLAIVPFAIVLLVHSATSRSESVKLALVWAIGLLAFASPWYLRNLALFDNPIFPFMNEILGAHNGFTRNHSELLRESVEGLGDFSFRTGQLKTFAVQVGRGFGPLPTILLLPGAWLGLRLSGRRTGVLVAGVALTFAALTIFAGFWFARYFLSLLVLSSSLSALALERLLSTLLRGSFAPLVLSRVVLVVLAASAILGGYPSWREHCRSVNEFRSEGRERFVASRAPYFAVAQWLNTHLADTDKVAIGFNVQPFYYLERPYYHIHPLTEGDLVTAQTPEQVEAALRRVGATVLAFSRSDGTYSERTAPKITAYETRLFLAMRRLRWAGRLRLLATVNGVKILRLEGGTDRQGPESF